MIYYALRKMFLLSQRCAARTEAIKDTLRQNIRAKAGGAEQQEQMQQEEKHPPKKTQTPPQQQMHGWNKVPQLPIYYGLIRKSELWSINTLS